MKTQKTVSLFSLFASMVVIMSLSLSPAFALAKDDEGKRERNAEKKEIKAQNKIERQSNKDKDDDGDDDKNRGCLRAFGHLIAPGWIKHNGRLTIGEECKLPLGIAKKYRNGTSTPTTTPPSIDNTAPIISTIVMTTGTTSIQVAWKTNEGATSKVYYGTSTPLNTSATSTLYISKGAFVKNHSIKLTGLSASTTHYFVIESTDKKGNVATSSELSATTGAPAPVVDTTPPVITNALAVVVGTTTNLSWTTNEPATTKAYFSTSTPVSTSSTTPYVENVALVTNHSLVVSSLGTSTLYHMLLESKDALGNTAYSQEFSFTTGN